MDAKLTARFRRARYRRRKSRPEGIESIQVNELRSLRQRGWAG